MQVDIAYMKHLGVDRKQTFGTSCKNTKIMTMMMKPMIHDDMVMI